MYAHGFLPSAATYVSRRAPHRHCDIIETGNESWRIKTRNAKTKMH